MRKIVLCSAMLIALAANAPAQSTTLRVYQIFQGKCVSCHGSSAPQAGLNLVGSGATEAARALDVRSKLVNVTPANTYAAAQGFKRIYPGRPDRSQLFRKVNNGLEPGFSQAAGEGEPMPPAGHTQLTTVEKELIRQYIQYGAPATGAVVSEQLLVNYYAGNAQSAFPGGPPPSPAPTEGFQIKMGPFYLAPGSEVEYFQKFETALPANVEVNRIQVFMGTYSHHFILYDFNPGSSGSIPHGLRLNADHSNISMVAAVQGPTNLQLPQGTAFRWEQGIVLDLNAHYINYSASTVYQAEVYINIYTQPNGTAAQEMKTDLIANINIPIPNNGNLITHSQTIINPAGQIFLWGIMGHTHKYGTSYKAYKRLPGGATGELIYDAACARGVPGCFSPYFDYRHIPMRYFDPLYPVSINAANGIIHRATWINDGPAAVNFGPTSADEMMVLVVMYTLDTAGVVSGLPEWNKSLEPLPVFPNPCTDVLNIEVPVQAGVVQLSIWDANGLQVVPARIFPVGIQQMDVSFLAPGLYVCQMRSTEGMLLQSARVIIVPRH